MIDQTDIWMLGVGAFGIVFYLFSLYYGRRATTSATSGEPSESEEK
ncbi:hypothetical protein R0135_09135 [Congregibacter variabilis]|uniref:Uncharacterized protein n=1 Tax=Congregibacter variabilis TaxID=3081200 RepID=A0ABZ0HYY2_9GAMM|nr:hypothetical protein R0135_09135 [Congregibacter sp. IMCC43200]